MIVTTQRFYMEKKIHQGRNVKRFREMLCIKQEGLAYGLGEEWSQKKISQLEQKEVIDDKLLQQIADYFNVPVEAIKNFDEETAVFNIQNNYEGSNVGAGSAGGIVNHNNNCTFNPLDKFVEQVNENVKLY